MYSNETIFVIPCQGLFEVRNLSSKRKKITKYQNKSTIYNRLKNLIDKLNIHKTQKKTLKRLGWYHVNCHSVYVSQKTLAKDLSLGLRTIERSMKALYDTNLVIKSSRKSLHKTNVYVINMTLLDPKNSCHQNSQKSLSHKEFSKKVAGEMAVNIERINKALKSSHHEDRFNLPHPPQPQKNDVKNHFSKNIPSENTEDHKAIAQEMIRIMDQETQGKIKPDPNYHCTHRKLFHHFKHRHKKDIGQWRAFCQRVGSSDYLMGRRNGFSPPLLWLLKDEVMAKMNAGEFHRETSRRTWPSSGAQAYENSQRSYRTPCGVPTRSSEQERIEKLKQDLIRDRRCRAESLSPEQSQTLFRHFEIKIKSENSLTRKEFEHSGWDSSYVRASFIDFKIKAVCGSFDTEFKKWQEEPRAE